MKRLVQLVRQARSHLAHHAQSSHVRQFGLMPLQLLIVGLFEYFLGLLQVFDVGGTSNPTRHLAVFPQHRDRADQMPAVAGVRYPPQPVLDFARLLGVCRMEGSLGHPKQIIGVHGSQPAVGADLCGGLARVFVPTPIAVDVQAVGTQTPSELRNTLDEKAVAFFACPQGLFSPRAIRNVHCDAFKATRLAGGIVEGASFDEKAVWAAIRPDRAILALVVTPADHGLCEVPLGAGDQRGRCAPGIAQNSARSRAAARTALCSPRPPSGFR